jgi:hypothetical protein
MDGVTSSKKCEIEHGRKLSDQRFACQTRRFSGSPFSKPHEDHYLFQAAFRIEGERSKVQQIQSWNPMAEAGFLLSFDRAVHAGHNDEL